MIVLSEPYGQISNRFFQHIHLDSFCKENGIQFYNPFIEEYANEYPDIPKVKLPIVVSVLVKLLSSSKILKKLFSVNFRDENQIEKYKLKVRNSRFMFCYGFFFRNYESTIKYRSHYQKIFSPKIAHADRLLENYLTRENMAQKIVAIHIRRGDYKDFEGGKYYYPDSVYLDRMHQVKKLYNDQCRFIVFTNDRELDQNYYSNSLGNLVRFSDQSVFVDHYLMSKCDLIVGPPSTVSLWASYMGEVLLFQIKDPNEALILEKLVICNG